MWPVFHILWLWHSGLFDYEHCCNTPQVNTDRLVLQWCMVMWPLSIAMLHSHVTVQHCNVAWLHGRPPTRSLFDNGKRHVTAFRPISEAARDNWSCATFYRSIFSLLQYLCMVGRGICNMTAMNMWLLSVNLIMLYHGTRILSTHFECFSFTWQFASLTP